MADFVTLSCPSCGGKLEISNDIDRFACSYCGHEHVVKRAGGIVALAPVVEAINGVKQGVDKTASELALVRLQKEIDDLELQKAQLLKQKQSINTKISDPFDVWTISVLSLGVLAIIASAFLFIIGDSDAVEVFVVGIIAIPLSGVMYLLKKENNRYKRKMIQANIKPVEDSLKTVSVSLQEKYADLNKHKEIVSG